MAWNINHCIISCNIEDQVVGQSSARQFCSTWCQWQPHASLQQADTVLAGGSRAVHYHVICLGRDSLVWQCQGDQVCCLVAQSTHKVLQKAGSRGHQLVKVWSWKLSHPNFSHSRQRASPDATGGHVNPTSFSWKRNLQLYLIHHKHIIHHKYIIHSYENTRRIRTGCHEGG